MTQEQENKDLKSLPASSFVPRVNPASPPLLNKPVMAGVYARDLNQAREVAANLERHLESFKTSQFNRIDQAEDSMKQLKELQVIYTDILNILSASRKLVASDLSSLRIAAARAKRESGKN